MSSRWSPPLPEWRRWSFPESFSPSVSRSPRWRSSIGASARSPPPGTALRTVRRLGWLRCLGAVFLAVVLLGVAFGGAGFAFEFGWTAAAGGEPQGRVEVIRLVTAGGLLLFAAALAWMFLSGLFASMYVQGRAALDDADG